MKNFISLNAPHLFKDEKKYIDECIKTNWVSSAGKYVDRFESDVAKYVKCKYAVACATQPAPRLCAFVSACNSLGLYGFIGRDEPSESTYVSSSEGLVCSDIFKQVMRRRLSAGSTLGQFERLDVETS